MTNEEKTKAFQMRLEGKTLNEIAEAFGTSKQNISEMFDWVVGKHAGAILKNNSSIDQCVFPSLKEAIIKYDLTLTGIFKILYKNYKDYFSCSNSRITYISKRLTGATNFSAYEWIQLSNYFEIPLDKLMTDNLNDHFPRSNRRNKDA